MDGRKEGGSMSAAVQGAIGAIAGAVAAVVALALYEPEPLPTGPQVHVGSFDLMCRTHTTAENYLLAEDREQFFELDVCGFWLDRFGFEPKATLYPLITIGEETVYYAAFPNGKYAIAIK